MISDSKRREVAARLRNLEMGVTGTVTTTGTLAKNILDAIKYGHSGAMTPYGLLADLIEPSEPTVKCVAEVNVDGERLEELVHDAAVELTGIDRDALLALAEEMEGEKRDISCATCRDDFGLACCDYKPNATCMEACLRYYARRIRWALGVEDGS